MKISPSTVILCAFLVLVTRRNNVIPPCDAQKLSLRQTKANQKDRFLRIPPPIENVCDPFQGKAKGLCIAYCLSKRCDLSDTTNPAKQKSCDRLRDSFLQEQPDLTRMPCDEGKCKCWENRETIFDANTPVEIAAMNSRSDGRVSYSVSSGDAAVEITAAIQIDQNGIKRLCRVRGGASVSGLAQDEFEDCAKDIFFLAVEADSLVSDSIERSPCEPYDVGSSSVTCPCWDESTPNASAIVSPDEGDLYSDAFQRSKSSTFSSMTPYAATYVVGSRSYGAYKNDNGYKSCRQPEIGLGNLSEEQWQVCYNDLLAESAKRGTNQCHLYFV